MFQHKINLPGEVSSSDVRILEQKIDLAAAKNGGKVLFATDDGFAVAENLLSEAPAEWREGVFTDFGKWMDGWETRRKRIPGHDWAIIQLGIPGSIQGFNIDTSYFIGNYPPQFSIQAALLTPEQESNLPVRQSLMGAAASSEQINKAAALRSESWEVIVSQSMLKPGKPETCNNYFKSLNQNDQFTHLRLNLYPDGGIARLRVFGTPTITSELVDLVAMSNGGKCIGFSDAHFGAPENLISPGRSTSMADGWETARRLDRPAILELDGNGHLKFTGKEWAVLALGHAGIISVIEIDTHHFKGNFPDQCCIEGCLTTRQLGEEEQLMKIEGEPWKEILPTQKLFPHRSHYFSGSNMILNHGPINLVRLTISPDGGVSRLRIWGKICSDE